MRATIAGFGMFAKRPPKVPKPLRVPRPVELAGHTKKPKSSTQDLRRFFGSGAIVYTPKES